jgi:hypothetical protein
MPDRAGLDQLRTAAGSASERLRAEVGRIDALGCRPAIEGRKHRPFLPRVG